jgi:hypothetical protein
MEIVKTMRVTEKPITKYRWYLRPFFWSRKRKCGELLKTG